MVNDQDPGTVPVGVRGSSKHFSGDLTPPGDHLVEFFFEGENNNTVFQAVSPLDFRIRVVTF